MATVLICSWIYILRELLISRKSVWEAVTWPRYAGDICRLYKPAWTIVNNRQKYSVLEKLLWIIFGWFTKALNTSY